MFCIKHTERSHRWIKYLVTKRGRTKKKIDETKNIDKALKYFEVAYPPIYGEKGWRSIKKALFRDKKYAALLNGFSTTEPTIQAFEELGAYNIGEFYNQTVERYNKSKTSMQEKSPLEVESSVNESQEELVRPKLYEEWTDEEKATEAAKPPPSYYPEEYRQRLAAAGHDVDTDVGQLTSMSDRVIKASHLKDTQLLSMQNHIPATKLAGLEDWIEEADVFVDGNVEDHRIGIKKVKEPNAIKWPEHLKLYSFIRGDLGAHFPDTQRCPDFNVFTHFLMGGASILPVIALDVQQGESVLDMCCAPGGKSLAILQTLQPAELVCRDLKSGRVARIHSLMSQFVPKGLSEIWDMLHIETKDGCEMDEPGMYDKVLVDVPCLNDRHTLNENENSIFKGNRGEERLLLPELQADLLFSAIHKCRPGGSIVYSTCTLSPLQNDGAVRLALAKIWKTSRIECTVVDLESTLKHLKFSFKFGTNLGLRYGHVVVPSYDENFGPMYFAKINRIK